VIIFLSDTDGDDVAIDARAIVAVTVGDVRPPVAIGDVSRPHRVTLVHTAAGPLVVAQSLDAVVDAWQGALRAEDALATLGSQVLGFPGSGGQSAETPRTQNLRTQNRERSDPDAS
jgi:hypothetical protein